MRSHIIIATVTYLILGFPYTNKCTAEEIPCPEPIVGSKLPELGEYPNNMPNTGCYEITSSASIDPAYTYIVDGNRYTIAVSETEFKVKYVATSDPKFRTVEGLSVDNNLSYVRLHTNRKPIKEPGWAYYIVLDSGWHAAFAVDQSMPELEPNLSSQIKWFFRR